MTLDKKRKKSEKEVMSNLARSGTSMEKLIIAVGITGSRITRDQTPYIPILPEEIARSGIESWKAGASVLHVHVRDPKTGLGTQDLSIFKEVVDRIRGETDALLCLTTSGIPGRNLPIEERLQSRVETRIRFF